VTDHLRRHLAPISGAAWELIEEEAGQALRHFLAGRKLVGFRGPLGWEHSAEGAGRVRALGAGPLPRVQAALRETHPLVELRTPFELSLAEMDDLERGRTDPDLSAVVDAARDGALSEDLAVFHGFAEAGIRGITEASPHAPLSIADDYNQYVGTAARAVATLRAAGVDGPYAIALGPRCYTGVVESTEYGGYPVLEHLRLVLGGPVVWAPGVNGAVVLSVGGDHFSLVVGQDFAVGYAGHDDTTVRLYLEESFTFRARTPEAAVAMVYAD
jgi:uncharacterized linocin/CFP29 family protein